MSIDSSICSARTTRCTVLGAVVVESVRAICMLLGISLTVVGLASIVLPLFPTTAALLASSYLLSRSWPSLQSRVKTLPIIGMFIKYLDGTRIMTTNAKLIIYAYLWGNLFVTCACLYGIGLASHPIVTINIFCCVLSMVFVGKFKAEETKVTQVKSEECADQAASDLGEIHLLESVQGVSKEIKESMGGLPHSPATLGSQFATSD